MQCGSLVMEMEISSYRLLQVNNELNWGGFICSFLQLQAYRQGESTCFSCLAVLHTSLRHTGLQLIMHSIAGPALLHAQARRHMVTAT